MKTHGNIMSTLWTVTKGIYGPMAFTVRNPMDMKRFMNDPKTPRISSVAISPMYIAWTVIDMPTAKP